MVLWGRRDGTNFCMHMGKQLRPVFLFTHSFSHLTANHMKKVQIIIHNICTYNMTQANGCTQETELHPLCMLKRLAI